MQIIQGDMSLKSPPTNNARDPINLVNIILGIMFHDIVY